MFRCERCGTGYNATVATIGANCPRCSSQGIGALLRFRLFEPTATSASKPTTKEMGQVAEVIEMWVFTAESGIAADPTDGVDVSGFGVEALDGSVGKVEEAIHDERAHALVVDTGPWIFGKKVVLPAGVIERVDVDDRKIYVHRTKDQIKDSPRFGDTDLDESGREEVGSYYGSTGGRV